MATIIELNKALDYVLGTEFPGVKVHSNDTEEGFSKPCFFTQIIPMVMDYDTTNYTSSKTMIIINYFSETGKEIDNLKMSDKLIKVFGMTLQVNGRHFLCRNIRSEIMDSVLQFKFDLDYKSETIKEKTSTLMGELEIEIKKE